MSNQGESVKISVEKHEKLYGIDEAPGADAPFGAPLNATNNQIGFELDRNQIPTGQIFKAGDGSEDNMLALSLKGLPICRPHPPPRTGDCTHSPGCSRSGAATKNR